MIMYRHGSYRYGGLLPNKTRIPQALDSDEINTLRNTGSNNDSSYELGGSSQISTNVDTSYHSGSDQVSQYPYSSVPTSSSSSTNSIPAHFEGNSVGFAFDTNNNGIL